MLLLLGALMLMLIGAQTQNTTQNTTQNLTIIPVDNPNNITIAYGSCLNTFDESSDIEETLQSIIRTEPDLWMWLGDAVYLDGETFFLGSLPGPGYDVSDGEFVQNTFNTLKNNPNYVQLKDSAPIIGIWDDHDYAYDAADGSFEFKERNKGFYLDFLDEPADSPRRNQSGVYTSYYIGEEKLLKVILLDTRYNREEDSTLSTILDTDTTSSFDDMLGEEQWAWLDAQLQDPNGTYTLLVSAAQYLPDDRPVVPNWFDDSRERLLDLIKTHQKSGVILLSGDVHYAEMIRHPCPARVGYKVLHEFTSSGITHSAEFVDIFDGVVDDVYSSEADRYFGKNFGLLKFVRAENSTDPPSLVFEARDAEGNVVLSREVIYADLVYDQAIADSYNGCNTDSSTSDTDNDDTGNDVDDAVNDIGETADDLGNDIGDAVDSIGNIFSKNK